MGGISLFLEQSLSFFRHLPRSLRQQFDRPSLLRGVSRFAIQTAPARLGRMTIGVLSGVEGPHTAEIHRLVRFLRDEVRPDVINLSNTMLASLAPPLRAALGVPIVSTLQGEESFIDALPQPYRAQAMASLRGHAASIDRFICCAQERIVPMAAWLELPIDRFSVVPTGLDPRPFARPLTAPLTAPPPGPPVLGYLSSIRPEKGLDLLLDALRDLVHSQKRNLRLHIAGQVLHKGYWRQIQRTIRDAGLRHHISCLGELDLSRKVHFLHQCNLFIMPTRLPESRAVAAMEALAAGVPVVASRLGVLPELLERTGGGVTIPPEDPAALAAAIADLLDNPLRAQRHAAQAPAAIAQHYSPAAMAQRTVEQYQHLLAARAT